MRVTQSTVRQFYAYERENKDGQFQVGHKHSRDDFMPIKSFKTYEEAVNFYMRMIFEEGLDRNLVIRDLVNETDTYLVWRTDEI